jgi:hypothetical protein
VGAELHELKTSFSIEASNWQDLEGNLPLTFSLSLRKAGESLLTLTPRVINSQHSTSLSQGDGWIVLRVYDSYDSYTETTAPISVAAAFASQGEKLSYIEEATNILKGAQLIDIRDQSTPSQISALSNAAFVSAEASPQTDQIYADLLQIMDDWTDRQGAQPNIASILTSTLATLTKQPSFINESALNSTITVARKVTSAFDSYIPPDAKQASVDLLSNLEESRKSSESNSSSTQGSDIREILMDYSRAFIKSAVRNEDPTLVDADNFSVYAKRASPAKISGDTLAFYSGSYSVSVKLPTSLLGSDVAENEAVDTVLTISKYKDYSLQANSTNSPTTSPLELVSGSSVVSLDFEVSGVEDEYGTVEQYEERRAVQVKNLSEPIQLSIPVEAVGASASTNCTWLNETSTLWMTSGCVLARLDVEAKLIYCNCTHLTQFSVKDSSEGLSEAAGSANTEQAANFGAITDINFSGNAAGLYVAISLLVLYILLGVLCRIKDKRDAEYEYKLRTDPQFMIEHDIRHSPSLYNELFKPKEPLGSGAHSPRVFPEPQLEFKEETFDFHSQDLKVEEMSTPPFLDDPNIPAKGFSSEFHELHRDDVAEEHSPEGHDTDPMLNTPGESALLYATMLGARMDRNAAPKINLERIKPPPRFSYTVNENLIFRKRKTLWELMVTNHTLLGLFCRTNVYFNRLARLTILFAGIYGKLFASGFFYNDSKAKEAEEEKTFAETLAAYTWTDFWLAILSALLVVPVIIVLGVLFKQKQPDDTMSPQKVENVLRTNRLKTIIAFGIAWGFMLFCGYEITIFSIQFNHNISSLWMTTFGLSQAYDMLVQMTLHTLARVLIVRTLFG